MKKVLAWCMAILCVFVVLFSVSFVTAERDHQCGGEDCPICRMISAAETLIKNISAAGALAFSCLFLLGIRLAMGASEKDPAFHKTLVSLKVKLTI